MTAVVDIEPVRPLISPVVLNPLIDPDHFIMEGIDCPTPTFKPHEMGKVFFARSPSWVRALDRKGFFVLDGVSIGTSRNNRNAREYTLADVEQVAHALASQGKIDGTQLQLALLLVQLRYQMETLRHHQVEEETEE